MEKSGKRRPLVPKKASKAKLVSHRSLPKFCNERPIEISLGIKLLEDLGLTPASNPMATIGDRGKSTLRYPVAEIWSATQKQTFLKRTGLVPAALEMERRAFRKALQIKMIDKPKDMDIKRLQKEKNMPNRSNSLRKLVGDSAKLMEQIHFLKKRPVSVFRLRPVHSNDELMPGHITARELENNKTFQDQTLKKLKALETSCNSLMSPAKKSREGLKCSPTAEFIRRRNPLKLRLQEFARIRAARLGESFSAGTISTRSR
jgi:hypothetical protein